MRVLIQRVQFAKVEVDNELVAQIDKGFLVFLGIHQEDSSEKIPWLAKKTAELRIFEDENEKMNLSLSDVKGQILLVSQFTLYANCEHGRRPDFIQACKPEVAELLYLEFAEALKNHKIEVKTGIFGADMNINLINDGPVTILLER